MGAFWERDSSVGSRDQRPRVRRHGQEQSHPSASRVTLKARLLADEMAIAKIWSVTEYLSDYRAGTIAPSTRIDDLIQQIPAWVDRLITEKS